MFQEFARSIMPINAEVIVVITALVVLIFDFFLEKESKQYLGWFSLFGIIFAAIATYKLMGANGAFFGGTFLLDPFSAFFKFVFYIASGLGILLSITYLKIEDIHRGEYYALLLFATTGMMLMASAGDLITLYLGLELMALSVYILAGFMRRDNRSNEAAIKYLLLGSFSSGIMLYGMSLLYGLSGTTNLAGILGFLRGADLANPVLFLAMIMLVVSFGFKVAAVPFHMWVPDVYEGAPTSVTAFMSAGPKVAGFAVLLRIFTYTLEPLHAHSTAIISGLAVLTMAVGNIMALSQTNIKRMLAYSSIAHAGYALVGLAAGGPEGAASVMLYVCIYALMNMGAFGVVIMLRKSGERGEEIADFAGLGKTNRTAAFLMLIFMFSLTGIPPMAGFIGKFYIFKSAVQAGLVWLAVAGVLFSAISAYFYLRIIMIMYMKEPKGSFELTTSPSLALALAISVTAVIVIGVYPTNLLNFARASIAGIM
ncbi:MAG TPA: NADH-quinone oxidoreductase subunit N [Nitrospirota bacterium]|nr:NADH-quinone oxidoreductase subunit N [Nitrospirota bacterium]